MEKSSFPFSILGLVAAAAVIIAAFFFNVPLILVFFAMGLCFSGILFREPAWGVILMALVLPLERLGAWDYQGITIRLSQIFLLWTFIFWILRSLFHRQWLLRPVPILLPLGIFFAGSFFGLVQTPNLERSVQVLVFTAFTALASILIPQVITTPQQVRRLFTALLLGAFGVALFGLFQFIGDMIGLPTTLTGLRPHYTKAIFGFPRIQSTALEPLYFANYLLIPIGLVVSRLLGKKFRRPSLGLLLLALFALNFILTLSRGGYVALMATLLIVGGFHLRSVFRPKTLVGISAGALILWISATTFLGFGDFRGLNTEIFSQHVSNIFSGASYFERITTFDEAIKMWKENPIVGTGLGSFGPTVSIHPYVQPADGWLIVNNEIIELLAETGIIGLFAMSFVVLIIIVRTLKGLHRMRGKEFSAETIGLLAAFVGFLVQYQTFSTLYVMHIWFVIGILIALQNRIFYDSDTR